MPTNDYEISPRSNLECTGVRALGGSGVIVAMANIRIPALGLTFIDCGVYSSDGVRYVCPPFVQREPGKYSPSAVTFDTNDMMYDFMDAALEAVLRFAPLLFEGRQ